jgi:hypothetical protein
MAMVAINPPCPNKNLVEHLPKVGGSTAMLDLSWAGSGVVHQLQTDSGQRLAGGWNSVAWQLRKARKDTTIPKKNGGFMRF